MDQLYTVSVVQPRCLTFSLVQTRGAYESISEDFPSLKLDVCCVLGGPVFGTCDHPLLLLRIADVLRSSVGS